MGAFIDELKHAFALDPPPPPEDGLPAVLERFAAAAVARGLEVPVILFLDTVRPLGFLAGQALFSVAPLIRALAGTDDCEALARALEDRRLVARLIARIEALAAGGGALP